MQRGPPQQVVDEAGGGELGVDDQVPTTRQMDNRIGPDLPVAHLTCVVASLDQPTVLERRQLFAEVFGYAA